MRLIAVTLGTLCYTVSLFVLIPLAVATAVLVHAGKAGFIWPDAWAIAGGLVTFRLAIAAHRVARAQAVQPKPDPKPEPDADAEPDQLGRVLALLADERGLTNAGLADKADLDEMVIDAALSHAASLDNDIKQAVLLGLWRAEPLSMERADLKRLLDAGMPNAVISASVEAHNKELANG